MLQHGVFSSDSMRCFLSTDWEAGVGHPSPPPGGAAAGGVLHQVHLRTSRQFLHHRGHEAGWSLVFGGVGGGRVIPEENVHKCVQYGFKYSGPDCEMCFPVCST